MAEEKSRSERRYGAKEAAKDAPKGEDKPAETKTEDKAPESKADDARGEMTKRHEKEHRDLHGQHRDAMRQMHSRQEAEMTAMNARQANGAAGGDPGMAMGGDEGGGEA